jgi:hypothetical protein
VIAGFMRKQKAGIWKATISLFEHGVHRARRLRGWHFPRFSLAVSHLARIVAP